MVILGRLEKNIMRDVEQGMIFTDILTKYNLRYGELYRWAKSTGVSIETRHSLKRKEVIAMFNSGKSISNIMSEANIEAGSLYHFLYGSGVMDKGSKAGFARRTTKLLQRANRMKLCILTDIEKGMRSKDIVIKYGISEGVRMLLKRVGFSLREAIWDRRKAVVKQKDDGKIAYKSLAKELGMSPTAMHGASMRIGIAIRKKARPRLTDYEKNERGRNIYYEYLKGKSNRAIANKYKIDISLVSETIREQKNARRKWNMLS